jgi:hypothetical protein
MAREPCQSCNRPIGKRALRAGAATVAGVKLMHYEGERVFADFEWRGEA